MIKVVVWNERIQLVCSMHLNEHLIRIIRMLDWLLKSIIQRLNLKKKIQNVLDGYTNVYLIEGTLNRDQVNSLTKCVDVVVSLHRAEGFGLVLAEAMLLGTPTIATNWSSNTEFMNKDVACMVDYKLITIERDIPPFKSRK